MATGIAGRAWESAKTCDKSRATTRSAPLQSSRQHLAVIQLAFSGSQNANPTPTIRFEPNEQHVFECPGISAPQLE